MNPATIDMALADIAHASKAITTEALAWMKERAELLERISKMNQASAAPTVRGAFGGLTLMKLSTPLRNVGKRTFENLIIDANGLNRLYDPTPGDVVTFRNVVLQNASRSAVEEITAFKPTDARCVINFENVTAGNTPGYTLFGAASIAKLANGQAPILVNILRGRIYQSDYETPLRFMPGVELDIDDSLIADFVDLGANGKPTSPPNKANAALRMHCARARLRRSTIVGMLKCGYEHATCERIELDAVDVFGSIEWEGKTLEKIVNNVWRNGSRYAA